MITTMFSVTDIDWPVGGPRCCHIQNTNFKDEGIMFLSDFDHHTITDGVIIEETVI